GRVKPTDKVKKGTLNWISASQAPDLRSVFSKGSSPPIVSATPVQAFAPPSPRAVSQYACRRCSSEHTTSLSMAFSSGVSRGNVQAASWNPDFGVTLTGGKTASQTDLSRMCAPPEAPTYWNETAWNFFAGGVLSMLVIAILIGCLKNAGVGVLLFMIGIF